MKNSVPLYANSILDAMIILFYKYITISNPNQIRSWQHALCARLRLKGRIILAQEGINGTLAGTEEAITQYMQAMQEHPLFGNIDFKSSDGSIHDFPRLRVVVKSEIVRLGIDPEKLSSRDGGKHLTPAQAHELMSAKPQDLVLLDGRNNYESRIGTFAGAITPDINNFRDLPEYIDKNLEQFQNKTVLMFCTGGIRCERASAYLKSKQTATEVLQISGGIHRYIEQFPDGHFKGKHYVFDGRIALPVSNDILGNCDTCNTPYDQYSNCINAFCNKQILSCPVCIENLYNSCSQDCAQLVNTKSVVVRAKPRRSSLINEQISGNK